MMARLGGGGGEEKRIDGVFALLVICWLLAVGCWVLEVGNTRCWRREERDAEMEGLRGRGHAPSRDIIPSS